MNRRQIYNVVVYLVALVAFVNVANAQSKNEDNPTPLTSNEISGFTSDNSGDEYFYTFIANPGKVTLNVKTEADTSGVNVSIVDYALFNENGSLMVSGSAMSSNVERRAGKTETINFTRRQRVKLRLTMSKSNYGSGKYRVQLSGAVEFGKGSTSSENTRGNSVDTGALADMLEKQTSGCLPKQGTLIIKMKDGSKKIIDLSEAETITVVP